MMRSVAGLFRDSQDLGLGGGETRNLMLAGMDTAVFMCSCSGKVESLNASATSLLHPCDNILELLSDIDCADRVGVALELKKPFEEIVEISRNNDIVHVLLRGRWLDQESDNPRLIVEGTDITELRLREKQLRVRLCRDELTGAASRRYFVEVGQRALLDTHRYGRPLSVLMLDLDDFKSINDNFGHAVGDQFLSFVAEVCIGLLRRNDTLGRLGGDEFAALLPGTSLIRAKSVAARLRRGLAVAMASNSISKASVTLSIGVAGSEHSDQSIHDVLKRADIALYSAKNAGRNAIHCNTTKQQT